MTDIIFFNLMNLPQFKSVGSHLEDRCKLEIAFEYDLAKLDCFLSCFAISLSKMVISLLSNQSAQHHF